MFQLANVAHIGRRYQTVEELYRQSVKLSPESVHAYNELALLLALRGRCADEALKSIDQTITLSGPLPFLLDTRASVHLAAGRSQQAIRDLENSIVDSSTAVAYFHLAQAHLTQGNRTEANRALRQGSALGLNADSVHPLECEAFEQLRNRLQGF